MVTTASEEKCSPDSDDERGSQHAHPDPLVNCDVGGTLVGDEAREVFFEDLCRGSVGEQRRLTGWSRATPIDHVATIAKKAVRGPRESQLLEGTRLLQQGIVGL